MKKRQGQQALFNELYRKILTLSFVFFLAACATGSQIISSGDVRIGMNKAELQSALYFTYPAEDPFINTGISIVTNPSTFYWFGNISKYIKNCSGTTINYLFIFFIKHL